MPRRRGRRPHGSRTRIDIDEGLRMSMQVTPSLGETTHACALPFRATRSAYAGAVPICVTLVTRPGSIRPAVNPLVPLQTYRYPDPSYAASVTSPPLSLTVPSGDSWPRATE